MRPGGLVALIALVAPAALAHSYLEASLPVDGAILFDAPETVELRFSEPVETRFSIFKVYPLEADSHDDPRLVNSLAAALVARVLRLRGDEEDRADLGLTATERTTSRVILALRPDLEPGAFVVMWRVLSVDTHTAEGFYVFHLHP